LPLDNPWQVVEYTGWSKNSLEKFYFNMKVLCSNSYDGMFPADFQVWFRPNNGGSDRMLTKQQKKIYGWRR